MALDLSRLPRDWGDPEREVRNCRTAAALFDFSFVARASIAGPAALSLIGRLTGRRLDDMTDGAIRYAVHAAANGRLVSDLTIWKRGPDIWEVMSGRPEDIAVLRDPPMPAATVTDLSPATSICAVQGPATLSALAGLADTAALARLGYYRHRTATVAGIDCLVGRLGYTGEAGFEIIAPRSAGQALWQALAARIPPAGFAAADVLRIEAGFALFANEFQVPVTAAEAGLASFAGPEGETAGEITLVCLTASCRERPSVWQPLTPPPRPTRAGEVAITSAGWSARAGGVLALGFARTQDIAAGLPLHDPRGVLDRLARAGRPFYDPGKQRPRRAWHLPW